MGPDGRRGHPRRDQLPVYSDGLFEVDGGGAILGQDGLLAMVAASYRDGGSFVMDDLLGGIGSLSRGCSFADDICLIMQERC